MLGYVLIFVAGTVLGGGLAAVFVFPAGYRRGEYQREIDAKMERIEQNRAAGRHAITYARQVPPRAPQLEQPRNGARRPDRPRRVVMSASPNGPTFTPHGDTRVPMRPQAAAVPDRATMTIPSIASDTGAMRAHTDRWIAEMSAAEQAHRAQWVTA